MSERLSNDDLIHIFKLNNHVRIRWTEDKHYRLSDLEGDSFSPHVNTDIPVEQLNAERAAFHRQIESDGVWGCIGEYFDGREWQHADSVYGFVGKNAQGYEFDIMQSTLDAFNNLPKCPLCHTPYTYKRKD